MVCLHVALLMGDERLAERRHPRYVQLLREPLSSAYLREVEIDSFWLLKEGHCFRENTLSACGRQAKTECGVPKAGSSRLCWPWWLRALAFPWCRKWRLNRGPVVDLSS